MAAKGSRRERSTYSVYRLESTDQSNDPMDPETKWVGVGFFETEGDAAQAAKLLADFQSDDAPIYGVVREIRQKSETPKVTRRIV